MNSNDATAGAFSDIATTRVYPRQTSSPQFSEQEVMDYTSILERSSPPTSSSTPSSGSGCYSAWSPDDKGAGVSFGFLQFNQAKGSLHLLLIQMRKNDTSPSHAVFDQTFPQGESWIALDEPSFGQLDLKPYKTNFEESAQHPEFRAAQREVGKAVYYNDALNTFLENKELHSERALQMVFDASNQLGVHGAINALAKAKEIVGPKADEHTILAKFAYLADSCNNCGGWRRTSILNDPGLRDSTMNPWPAGKPTQLVFTTQPGNAASMAPLAPKPMVMLEDARGTVVATDSTHTVKVALTNPNGAVLSGTKTVILDHGVATFTDLSVDRAGTYTLTATTDLGNFKATSSNFQVTVGPASRLSFQSQPGDALTDAVPSRQPVVQLQDAGGNVVASDSAHIVTLSLTTPNGATLGGATTLKLVRGVAAFSNLNINLAGGYTLTAGTDAGAFTRQSAPFTVSGPATQLIFATQPGGAQSLQALAPQPVVWLEDANGNVVTTDSRHRVRLALTAPNGAALAGTSWVAFNHGVATFAGLRINKAGSYTLTAGTSVGTFTATSAAFAITPADGTQLAFATQPGGAPAGVPFATQPVVQLKDASGNLVTTDSIHTVTVALTTPGTATLAGTRTVTLVNGVATFAGLSIDRIGSYTLTATSNVGASSKASWRFAVSVGQAAQLAFSQQPGDALTGSALTRQPIVQLQDAGGNVVTTDSTHTVTLALTAPNGATLGGTTTLAFVHGVATFSGLKVDLAGTYTLTASTTGGFTRQGAPFMVSGPAAQLVFATQPGNARSGRALAPQPVVWLEDAGGNVVTADSTHSVTVTLTTAGGAVLGGTRNLAFNHGVVSFAGLNVNRAGSYTLTAKTTAGTFTQASASFTVS